MTIDIYKIANETLDEITKLSVQAEKDFHVAEGMKKGVVALYERIKEALQVSNDPSGVEPVASTVNGGLSEEGASEAPAADETAGAAGG